MSVAMTARRVCLYPLALAFRAAETVILLPVLATWFLLYRWSPDPP